MDTSAFLKEERGSSVVTMGVIGILDTYTSPCVDNSASESLKTERESSVVTMGAIGIRGVFRKYAEKSHNFTSFA